MRFTKLALWVLPLSLAIGCTRTFDTTRKPADTGSFGQSVYTLACKRVGQVELPSGRVRPTIDNLREHRLPVEGDEDADPARQGWLRDAFGVWTQNAPAGSSASERSWTARAGERDIGALSLRARAVVISRLRSDRKGNAGREQCKARKCGLAHCEVRPHPAGVLSSSPNDSRTRSSNSSGSVPSGPA